MDILDIYDKYRNLTGRKMLKNQYSDLRENEFTLFTYLAIFNEDNEMLIQKRHHELDRSPNLWDITASGHALSGEVSNEAIERKLLEELGYEYSFEDERPYFTVNGNKSYGDVYIINEDVDINNLRLNYNKVQNVTWANKEEILQLIDEKKFIPYSHAFIEMIFANKNMRGALMGDI